MRLLTWIVDTKYTYLLNFALGMCMLLQFTSKNVTACDRYISCIPQWVYDFIKWTRALDTIKQPENYFFLNANFQKSISVPEVVGQKKPENRVSEIFFFVSFLAKIRHRKISFENNYCVNLTMKCYCVNLTMVFTV